MRKEKIEATKTLNKYYDYNKVKFGRGRMRTCEDCQQLCCALSYCEICIRKYLETEFLNWTSGSTDIDDLLKKC